MRLGPRNLKQAVALRKAEKLFRKIFFDAVSRFEEAVRENYKDPELDLDLELYRARWSKADVMNLCEWEYLSDWRILRSHLEKEIGLIMLMRGSRRPWVTQIQPWTFATSVEDREWGVAHAIRCQIGGMKRTAKVTAQALAPPDEVHALDEGSKTQIDLLLKTQNVKLDTVLKTLQSMKDSLLEQETMKLLAEYGE